MGKLSTVPGTLPALAALGVGGIWCVEGTVFGRLCTRRPNAGAKCLLLDTKEIFLPCALFCRRRETRRDSAHPRLLLALHHWKSTALNSLHVRRGGGTSDNFDELAGNDGLASAVEENLVSLDHVSGVLGGVLRDSGSAMWETRKGAGKTHIHGVAAGRDLAGVTLAQGPEDGVGKGVFAEVGKDTLLGLEGSKVG